MYLSVKAHTCHSLCLSLPTVHDPRWCGPYTRDALEAADPHPDATTRRHHPTSPRQLSVAWGVTYGVRAAALATLATLAALAAHGIDCSGRATVRVCCGGSRGAPAVGCFSPTRSSSHRDRSTSTSCVDVMSWPFSSRLCPFRCPCACALAQRQQQQQQQQQRRLWRPWTFRTAHRTSRPV